MPHEARRYNGRTAAERTNARLKDEFGGNDVRARGHAKIMSHLMFGLLAYDQRRDAWLRSQGYTILRFWNNEVMQQLEGMLERMHMAITLSPTPSPTSGRGELTEVAARLSR